MRIGPVIKELRLEKGIKQRFVAEKLGYSHSSGLCELEKGAVDLRASDIPKVAAALDMDVLEVCKRFFLR